MGVSPKWPRPSIRVEKETGPGELSPEIPCVMISDYETRTRPDGVVALLTPEPVPKVRDRFEGIRGSEEGANGLHAFPLHGNETTGSAYAGVATHMGNETVMSPGVVAFPDRLPIENPPLPMTLLSWSVSHRLDEIPDPISGRSNFAGISRKGRKSKPCLPGCGGFYTNIRDTTRIAKPKAT